MHTDTQISETFCQRCYMHLKDAHEIAVSCADKPCTIEQYDRIYHEFRNLQAQARTLNYRVIDKYAMNVAAFARYLRDKANAGITAAEQALLVDGIQFGLRCGGSDLEKCPSMHYDELLPLLNKITQQQQSH